jgi:alpha-glucuronidase
LLRGLGGLLGTAPLVDAAPAEARSSSVRLHRRRGRAIATDDQRTWGREGYRIRSVIVTDRRDGDRRQRGYWRAVRRLPFPAPAADGQSLERLDLRETPKLRLRMLDHWTALDGHVERGYAGASIWDWHKLPDHLDPRYTDYARANASLGINATVLNNVNANATSLTADVPWTRRRRWLTCSGRYGIRVFLSARFSAPAEIGGLKTADPLDPLVRQWWRAKADEIHARIPDFGGFPGQGQFGRAARAHRTTAAAMPTAPTCSPRR